MRRTAALLTVLATLSLPLGAFAQKRSPMPGLTTSAPHWGLDNEFFVDNAWGICPLDPNFRDCTHEDPRLLIESAYGGNTIMLAAMQRPYPLHSIYDLNVVIDTNSSHTETLVPTIGYEDLRAAASDGGARHAYIVGGGLNDWAVYGHNSGGPGFGVLWGVSSLVYTLDAGQSWINIPLQAQTTSGFSAYLLDLLFDSSDNLYAFYGDHPVAGQSYWINVLRVAPSATAPFYQATKVPLAQLPGISVPNWFSATRTNQHVVAAWSPGMQWNYFDCDLLGDTYIYQGTYFTFDAAGNLARGAIGNFDGPFPFGVTDYSVQLTSDGKRLYAMMPRVDSISINNTWQVFQLGALNSQGLLHNRTSSGCAPCDPLLDLRLIPSTPVPMGTNGSGAYNLPYFGFAAKVHPDDYAGPPQLDYVTFLFDSNNYWLFPRVPARGRITNPGKPYATVELRSLLDVPDPAISHWFLMPFPLQSVHGATVAKTTWHAESGCCCCSKNDHYVLDRD